MSEPAEATETAPAPAAGAGSTRSLVQSIVVNGFLPWLGYKVLHDHMGYNELHSLLIISIFPIFGALYGVLKARTVDFMSGIVLGGIVLSIIAIGMGGSPQVLLVRESMLTAALGAYAWISLFVGYPITFFLGRAVASGNDPEKIREWNERWEIPEFRAAHRHLTFVWGTLFILEFVCKVALVYSVDPATVLAVAPFLSWGLTGAGFLYTNMYARRRR